MVISDKLLKEPIKQKVDFEDEFFVSRLRVCTNLPNFFAFVLPLFRIDVPLCDQMWTFGLGMKSELKGLRNELAKERKELKRERVAFFQQNE